MMLSITPTRTGSGFAVDGYAMEEEVHCTLTVAGVRAGVDLFRAIRRASPPDTLYMASIDAELRPAQILSGTLIAPSAAQRLELLGAIRDLRLLPP